jgi:hypothetical protein
MARAQAVHSLRPWAVPDTKGLDAVRVLALALGGFPLAAVVGAALVGIAVAWPRGDSSSRPARAAAILAAGALGGNILAWLVQFVPALHMRLEPWYLVGLAVWTMPVVAFGIVQLLSADATASRVTRRAPVAAVAVALIATGAEVADWRAWLMPRGTARQAADVVARDGRAGDLVVVFPPAHASAFSFYYRGPLEQWAPPFERRITHVPWVALSGTFIDDDGLRRLCEALGARLRAGHRIWFAAAPAPDDQRTAYARQLGALRARLIETMSTYGHGVTLLGLPAERTWEPLELTRFDGIQRDAWPTSR